ELKSVVVQQVVGSERLKTEGSVGKPSFLDVHQGKELAFWFAALVLSGVPDGETIGHAVAKRRIQFAHGGFDVLHHSIIRVREIQGVDVGPSVALDPQWF